MGIPVHCTGNAGSLYWISPQVLLEYRTDSLVIKSQYCCCWWPGDIHNHNTCSMKHNIHPLSLLYGEMLGSKDCFYTVSNICTGSKLIWVNILTIIGADALAPCIARPSAAMILIMYNRQVFVLHEEGIQLPVPCQCGAVTWNVNICFCFLWKM